MNTIAIAVKGRISGQQRRQRISTMALRAYYFGLAALAWFVHPYCFMAATAWVVLVTYRREYRSHALKILME